MALEDMRGEEFEELKRKAESGDVDAMTTVGDAIQTYYAQQGKPAAGVAEALPWYEQAANCGSVYGAYKSVLGKNILRAGSKSLGAWEKVIDISNDIFQYARIVLHDPDVVDKAKDQVAEIVEIAGYNFALALYLSHREEDVITFLDSTHIEKGMVEINSLLYGLCKMSDPSEAYEWLHILEGNGKNLLSDTKDIYDESIIMNAYGTLSAIYRIQMNDCDRARDVLLEGLEVIDHPELNALLQKELAHYRKKMFGGYQYVG